MVSGHRMLLTAFFIVIAMEIVYFWHHPDPNSELPLPPPNVFTAAAIAYGGLSLIGDFFNWRIAGVLALALTLAVIIKYYQNKTATSATTAVAANIA